MLMIVSMGWPSCQNQNGQQQQQQQPHDNMPSRSFQHISRPRIAGRMRARRATATPAAEACPSASSLGMIPHAWDYVEYAYT